MYVPLILKFVLGNFNEKSSRMSTPCGKRETHTISLRLIERDSITPSSSEEPLKNVDNNSWKVPPIIIPPPRARSITKPTRENLYLLPQINKKFSQLSLDLKESGRRHSPTFIHRLNGCTTMVVYQPPPITTNERLKYFKSYTNILYDMRSKFIFRGHYQSWNRFRRTEFVPAHLKCKPFAFYPQPKLRCTPHRFNSAGKAKKKTSKTLRRSLRPLSDVRNKFCVIHNIYGSCTKCNRTLQAQTLSSYITDCVYDRMYEHLKELGSKALDLGESVAALMLGISVSDTWTQIFLHWFAFHKSITRKPVFESFYKVFKRIFDISEDFYNTSTSHLQPQSIPQSNIFRNGVKWLREAIDGGKSIQNCEMVTKCQKLYMHMLSSSFADKLGYTFTEAGYTELEQHALRRKYKTSGVSFYMFMLDSSVFFLEKGIQVFDSGHVGDFFHDGPSYGDFYDRYMTLKDQSNYLPNPDGHVCVTTWLNDASSFVLDGKLIIDRMTAIKQTSKVPYFIGIVNEIATKRTKYLATVAGRAQRDPPFTLLLHGTVGVGKSIITRKCMTIFSRVYGLDNDDKYIYTRSCNEKHWNNFDSGQWGLVLDDIASIHPSKAAAGDPSVMDLIQICNTVAFMPEQASIENKGTTPLLSKIVIGTTNRKDLNAPLYFQTPSAIARRFKYVVTVIVKPEFRKPNSSEIDGDKVEAYRVKHNGASAQPNLYSVEYKTATTSGNGQVDTTVLHRDISGEKFFKWLSAAMESHKDSNEALRESLKSSKTYCSAHNIFGVCGICKELDDLNCPSVNTAIISDSNSLQTCDDVDLSQVEEACMFSDDDSITSLLDAEAEKYIFYDGPESVDFKEAPLKSRSILGKVMSSRGVKEKIKSKLNLRSQSKDEPAKDFLNFFHAAAFYCAICYYGLEDKILRNSYALERWYTTENRIVEQLYYRGEVNFFRRWFGALSRNRWTLCKYESNLKSHASLIDRLPDREDFVEIGEKVKSSFCEHPYIVAGLVASVTAAIYMYKTTGKLGVQGNNMSRPKAFKEEKTNIYYYRNIPSTSLPQSPSSKLQDTYEQAVQTLSKCVFHLKVEYTGEDSKLYSRSCSVISLGGCNFLTISHAFRGIHQMPINSDHEFKCSMIVSPQTDGITRNIDHFILVRKDISIIGSKDLCVFRLLNKPTRFDLGFLFPAERVMALNHPGDVIMRDHSGLLDITKIIECHIGSQGNYVADPDTSFSTEFKLGDSPTYTLQSESFVGMCGGLVCARSRANGITIIGIHVAGMGHTGRCFPITYGEIENAILDIDNHTPQMAHSGDVNLVLGDYKADLSDTIHKRAPFNHVPSGSAECHGSFTGFRPTMKSQVEDTTIRAQVGDVMQLYSEHVPPDLRSLKPKVIALEALTAQEPINQQSLNKCMEALYLDIVTDLSKEQMDALHPYDMDTVVNGMAGITYVDKMNFNTSMGFPINKSKRYFLSPLPSSEFIPDGKEFSDEIIIEIERMRAVYKEGKRNHVIFKAHLKDEPVTLKKRKIGKTRVFTGSPVAFSILMRQYFLCFVRVMQNNKFTFECAVGTNAQSSEWGEIFNYLTNNGQWNKLFAGDFKLFDKKACAAIIRAAFEIFIRLASSVATEDGVNPDGGPTFSFDDVTVMIGLATDTSHPLVDFFGELIQFYGGNPSGHALTVLINCLMNSMYMRLAFMGEMEKHGVTLDMFQDLVHVITYGDDNTIGVAPSCLWFNHTVVQRELAKIGVQYTMADKSEGSVPFQNIEEIDFLKRKFVVDEESGFMMAPLDIDSIAKMLCVHVVSKEITPEHQSAEIIRAANREFCFHGRAVFDIRHKQLLEVIDRCLLSEYFRDQHLLEYDEILATVDFFQRKKTKSA